MEEEKSAKGGSASGGKTQESEIEKLKRELTEKDTELGETKNKLLRALADFDNFRKRSLLERDEVIAFANEALISGLLPIIDNFERALEVAKKTNSTENLVKGIALVKKQIEDLLAKSGVREIEAMGKPFDPNFHEVVMQKEIKEEREGVVIEEMQKGYTLHGKVIRPSMVITSSRQVGTGKKGV